MMRSVAAVVAGYVVMAALIGLKFALVQQYAPATFTSVPGLLSIVATDALAALAGGYVLALVARRAAVKHAIVLGAILLPLGVLNAVLNAGQEPFWFQMAVLAALVVALPCGAWLRRPNPAETLAVAR